MGSPPSATESEAASAAPTPSAAERIDAQRRLGWIWIVASIVLVCTLGVAGIGAVGSAIGPSFETEVAASEDGTVRLDGDSFDVLDSVAYAGLDLAVVEARGVPENRSGKGIIVVELALRNTRSTQARVPKGMLQLIHDSMSGDGTDGVAVPVDRFEFSSFFDRLVMEAGEVVRAAAVFRLPPHLEAEPERFALHLAEDGRIPAAVPLVGLPANAGFPQTLTPAEGDATNEPRAVGSLSVTITNGSADVDFAAYRAQLGRHLVVVDTVVEAAPGDQTALDDASLPTYWGLVSDPSASNSETVSAARVELGPILTDDGTLKREARLVFDCAAGAAALTVTAGVDASPVATFVVPSFE